MENTNASRPDTERNVPPPDPAVIGNYRLNQFGETVFYRSVGQATDHDSGQEPPAPVPDRIGRYQVRGVLGRGGFGAVYHGYDPQLHREVAIKVPLPLLTEDLEQTALREARQLAQLSHPNIVTVHDVGVDNGVCFIVSEYLKGMNLNAWLKERTVSWQEAVEIVATLADALALAHARNTVHRDVKLANVIMTERGDGFAPVLVDFGLALSEASARSSLAQRGVIAGTLNYMSPEQARGEGHRIDGRTDIYSLGVILYRMLSGQFPFTAESAAELLQAVIKDEARPLRQFVRGIPRELERICLKALAKQVGDRHTTAGDLAGELRCLLRDPGPAPPRPAGKAPDKAARREGARILIADDQELSRFKLQHDLEKWGHEVTAAEDGERAWELFQSGEFSIVITDWMMPGVDGLELVRRIRSSPSTNYVYVIMLTAKAEKHDIVAGMGAGADDFLTKPFHRDELQLRVRAGTRVTGLHRELNEARQRLERSHEALAQIQRSFLPAARPDLTGFETAWDYRPSAGLGGDMLGIVPLGDNQVALYVLDVTGDRVPAALLVTALSRVLSPPTDAASLLVERGAAGSAPRVLEPVEVLRALNRRFGTQEGKQFFTLAYGVLNLSSREFRFASAGHVPPLHQRANESPRMLDAEGFPIGMAPDSDEFQQRSVALKPGDRLLLYSDDLTDALNEDREVFGAARLIERVAHLGRQPLDDVIRSLLDDLGRWRGKADLDDDLSILAVEAL